MSTHVLTMSQNNLIIISIYSIFFFVYFESRIQNQITVKYYNIDMLFAQKYYSLSLL